MPDSGLRKDGSSPSWASGFRLQEVPPGRTVVAKVHLWGEVDQYLCTALLGPQMDIAKKSSEMRMIYSRKVVRLRAIFSTLSWQNLIISEVVISIDEILDLVNNFQQCV